MARRRDRPFGRRLPIRSALTRFTLFTEGENTEPSYFQSLRTALGPTIAIKIYALGSSPIDIAKDAVKYVAQNELRGADATEHQVWAVFDHDDHHDFNVAIALCEQNSVRVAYSSPCFELWLLLHLEDYQKPNTSRVVQKLLEKKLPSYKLGRGKLPDCTALIAHVETAEKRAEQLLARSRGEGALFGNPSTTVFELTRAIRAAAEASRRR